MDKQQMLDAVEHYVHAHFVEKNYDLWDRIVESVAEDLDIVMAEADEDDHTGICDAVDKAMCACQDAARDALNEWALDASEAAVGDE